MDQVLDVGTGTGNWAIDFGMCTLLMQEILSDYDIGDSHPEAKVIGIDLSPIQPGW